MKTPLHAHHVAANAKIVDFAGWEMPLHYGSQVQEHQAVRNRVGMFDASHMLVTDIEGDDAERFLRYLLANDVAKLKPGQALYSCLLNEQGGVLDDCIIYLREALRYRLVTNAGTAEKIGAWLQQQASQFNVTLKPRRELCIIAVQGPEVLASLKDILPADLWQKLADLLPFHACEYGEWFVGRTGYTGEMGFEFILPTADAQHFWQQASSTIQPCGLGARDTLRLEAGLNLYGTDMDEQVTPLESNLAWTIAWQPEDRNFIGRTALENQKKQGVNKQLVGLVLEDRGVLRGHQVVYAGDEAIGEILSGTFSPSLQLGIALARVNKPIPTHASVDIRGKKLPVKIHKPPFVRLGKSLV